MDTTNYLRVFDKHLSEDPNIFWLNVLNNDGLCRIVTDYQIFSPKEKMQQYYLTSMGIKLGQALEELFSVLLDEVGADFSINRREVVDGYDCDQIFRFNDKVVLIEQKIRDDHDSAKKRGQIDNYKHKKEELLSNEKKVYSCMWFIDPLFSKNKKYYVEEVGAEEVLYGNEIENFLAEIFEDERCKGINNKLITLLREYRNTIKLINHEEAIQIDYMQLQPKALWQFLVAIETSPELLELFGEMDYVELLTSLKKKRATDYTKKAISLLEEKVNE
jgi:hypothetical protein